jgi:hypothetical protein
MLGDTIRRKTFIRKPTLHCVPRQTILELKMKMIPTAGCTRAAKLTNLLSPTDRLVYLHFRPELALTVNALQMAV